MKRSILTWLLAAAMFVTSLPAGAAEWEWDPTWGYSKEEWYDPSDWFNQDQQISYETGYYGNYYDGDYDYDYYDNYGYDYDYYTDDWYSDEPYFDTWY